MRSVMKEYDIVLPVCKTCPVPGCRTGHFKLYTFPGHKAGGVLQLEERKKPKSRAQVRRYAISESESPGVFRFSKPGGRESYDVNVMREPASCECKGYLRHGTCAHIQAVLKLVAVGALVRRAGTPPRAAAGTPFLAPRRPAVGLSVGGQ